jgi:hypothetical protein
LTIFDSNHVQNNFFTEPEGVLVVYGFCKMLGMAGEVRREVMGTKKGTGKAVANGWEINLGR